MELVPHNLLAAHMFHILTGCQAMQHLQINPTKNQTIHTLLQRQFPAIKSSNNKPTYYVTPKTIGYIHGIVTDCITCLSTDACNQRALRNEIMILEVLEALEPAVFRHNLGNTLTHYYEEIQSMSGAGGRPKPKHFKLKMNVDGGLPLALQAAEAEDNDQPLQPAAAAAGALQSPAADDIEAPAPAATPPAKKGRGKGNGAKA
jgi:hypothetical protein